MMMDKTKAIQAKKINYLDYVKYVALIAIVVVFTCINSNYIGETNIKNILADIGPLLVISCGVTFVLLLGSIDLSIGSICSCAAVLFAFLIKSGFGIWAYPLTILFGAMAGLINGVAFTRLKVPSFIVTLGAMSLWQSAAYLISGGGAIQLTKKFWPFIDWIKIKFSVFSIPFFISLILLIVMFVFQNKTEFGIKAKAIGANEAAARVAGVNVNYVKTLMFVVCGICCSIGAIFLSAKLKSGIPNVGNTYSLLGVAAAVLGGTSLAGGKGGVLGTLLGSLMVVLIQNGMNIAAISPHVQLIVFGSLVILAVMMVADRNSRNQIIK